MLVMGLLGFVCMLELFVNFDCVLMHLLEFSVCFCSTSVERILGEFVFFFSLFLIWWIGGMYWKVSA